MFKHFLTPFAAVALTMTASSALFAQTPITIQETEAAVRDLAEFIDEEFYDENRAHQIAGDLIVVVSKGLTVLG